MSMPTYALINGKKVDLDAPYKPAPTPKPNQLHLRIIHSINEVTRAQSKLAYYDKWRFAIATEWNQEGLYDLSPKQAIQITGKKVACMIDKQMSFPGDILYGVFDGNRYVWSGKDPKWLARCFKLPQPLVIPTTDRFWVPPSIQAMLDSNYEVAEELKDL
jgi:hypothetical protein